MPTNNTTNRVTTTNRIIYVDPNDAYGFRDKNGNFVETTIPQEDLCIAFDLRVENFSRFSQNKASQGDFVISWTTGAGDDYSASFLEGDDFGKSEYNDGNVIFQAPRYLTTYYTDISYDNYGTKRIVEGLGITQVQIGWESWYTPTVVIKFVDVRGSGLWGNEEAIHENGKITADNIFGCFFTQPYPRFRLQVKGFLGKPITLQLTCSGFKGEYNSETGNFEATANFIGYSYSLLTDIPLSYIIMAPNCDYVGRAYWDEHVGSEAWRLSDGSTPIRLSAFFNQVKGASAQIDESYTAMTEDESNELTNIANKRSVLRGVKSSLESFIASLKTSSTNFIDMAEYVDDIPNRQVLLFFKSDQVTVEDEARKRFNKLLTDLEEYNSCYQEHTISQEKLPNKWKECPTTLTAIKMFDIVTYYDGETKISIHNATGQSCTISTLLSKKLNDKRRLIKPIATNLCDIINKKEGNKSLISEYVYLIDVYDFLSDIDEELDRIRCEDEKIKARVANKMAEDVKRYVGFKPYIGDVFKVIMCHLETFIHIIFSAYNQIKTQCDTGMRSPRALGLTLEETDMPLGRSFDYVTAWPKVLNNGAKSIDAGDIDSSKTTIGWVGDFSHNFHEEEVVLAIERAIRNMTIEYNNVDIKKGDGYLPICVSDIVRNGSPFGYVASNLTPSALAGYLGFRAFQLLGVFTSGSLASKYAELFGKMDAYNLYALMDVTSIKDKILSPLGNGANGDTFVGVALCDKQYDDIANVVEGSETNYHDFETATSVAYDSRGRHPIMVSDGSNYTFAHYYDSAHNSLIPSTLENYNNYKDYLTYNSSSSYSNTSFTLNISSEDSDLSTPLIYACNTSAIIGSLDKTKFLSPNMFNIIKDKSSVDSLLDVYGSLESGSIAIGDLTMEADFGDYVRQFWIVDEDSFSRWFYNTNLSFKRSDLEVDEDKLIPLTSGGLESTSFTSNSKWLNNKSNSIIIQNGLCFPSNQDSTDACSLDNLTIQQFIVYHNKSYGGNIFGSPFYYMQNGNLETDDKGVTAGDRKRYVKGLLFLHTLKYDYGVTLNAFASNKNSGTIESVPYGYLLLLGGLLWRRRYNDTYGADPIIWSEGSTQYQSCTTNYSLLMHDSSSNYKFVLITTQGQYNVSLQSLCGGIANVDINIENCLINLFTTFIDNQFPTIRSSLELRSNDGTDLTHSTLLTKIKGLTSQIKSSSATNVIKWLESSSGFSGWRGNYRMLSPNNDVILNMLTEETLDAIDTIKDIYMRKVLVLDNSHLRLTNSDSLDGELSIPQQTYRAYVSSFANTLRQIVEEGQVEDVSNNPYQTDEIETNKDICLGIYIYIKNLWDKWLCPLKDTQEGQDTFTISRFFNEHFIFIDSFYCNVAGKLPVNCEKLLEFRDSLVGGDNQGFLFTFLDSILSTHGCMFFSLPDFVGFTNDLTQESGGLEDMFRAIPYNDLLKTTKNANGEEVSAYEMKTENKFVAIYVNRPAETIMENGDFRNDGFDIWSRSRGTAIAPSVFSTKKAEDMGDNIDTTRYGYYVPSFGVAANRQNNHIFKHIRINMDNPVMTEYAAKALENIYSKGGDGERKVAFHGQDIYQIYSNYAYSCEVEMMGNAQVWPLMYFQLLNIPMWRGAYIIYKVTHSIEPGNMTTTFVGQKMTSTPICFAQSFFSIRGDANSTNETSEYGSYSGGTYGDMPSEYTKVNSPQDHWHNKENWQKHSVAATDPNGSLITLYNQLFEEIELLEDNKGSEGEGQPSWNVMITNVWSGGGHSDHPKGRAMDLTVMHYKNGKSPISADPKGPKAELAIALDLIFCNHRNQVRQVILEYRNRSDMHNGYWPFYHVLHVAVKTTAEDKNDFYIGAQDIGFTYINKGVSNQSWFLSNVVPRFKQTAARCWFNDRQSFFQSFNNYKIGNFSETVLNQHFEDSVPTFKNVSVSQNVADRIKEVMDELKKYLPRNSCIGICANMMRESGDLNPSLIGDSGAAKGLCQWHPDRQGAILSYAKKRDGITYTKFGDIPLATQAYCALEEMKTRICKSPYANCSEFKYLQNNGNDTVYNLAYFVMYSFERPSNLSKDQETNKKKIDMINSSYQWANS